MAIDANAVWKLKDAIVGLTGSDGNQSRTIARCVGIDKSGMPLMQVIGSSIVTPLNGTQLSKISVGDEVEVIVENGAMSAVGNISSPSVGADYVGEALEPVNASVDELNAISERNRQEIELNRVQLENAREGLAQVIQDASDLGDALDNLEDNVIPTLATKTTTDSLGNRIQTIEADYATGSELSNYTTTTVYQQGISGLSQTITSNYNSLSGTISQVSGDLEDYKDSNDEAVAGLQSQLDGQIEAWYYSVDPTTSNAPASSWTTNAEKERHVGDLYYNVTNGHSWRWMESGSTYKWQKIPDSDAAAALAAAQDAQATADGKRRIFTSTPVAPYDVGDLWVTGSVVKYATQLRTGDGTTNGSYHEEDWSLTATDDTLAASAKSIAEQNAQDILQAQQDILDNKALAQAAQSAADAVGSDLTSYKGTVSTTYHTISDYNADQQSFRTAIGETYSTKTELSAVGTTATNALNTANSNIRSTTMLWFTKANTTAPNPPTQHVTSSSTAGNAWRTVVPVYNASYPYYYYCYEYLLADGTYSWSPVTYDRGTTEAQSVGRGAQSAASAAQTAADNAQADITAYKATVSNTYSTKTELNQTKDAIELAASQTYGTKTEVQTVQNNLSTFEQTVESTYATQAALNVTNQSIALHASEISELTAGTLAFIPTKHVQNDADFWYTAPSTNWTMLEDGWAHYEITRAADASTTQTYLAPKNWSLVHAGEAYTFIVEVRNFSADNVGTDNFAYMQEMAGAQFWGTSVESATGSKNTSITYANLADGEGTYTKRFVKLADVDYIGPETTYDGLCFRERIYLQAGHTAFDMRFSVYPGEYDGDYSDYISDSLNQRVTSAEASIVVNANNIESKVSKDGVISSINQSAESVKIQASKVEIDGTAIFTNSDFQSSLAQTQVAGENLLRRTSRFTANMWARSNASVPRAGIIRLTSGSAVAYATYNVNYLDYADYSTGTYTLSFEARIAPVDTSYTSAPSLTPYIGFQVASRYGNALSSTYDRYANGGARAIGDDWERLSFTVDIPTDLTTGQESALVTGSNLVVHFNNAKQCKPVEIRRVKLERGSVATLYSEAPSDAILPYGGRNLLRNTGAAKNITVDDSTYSSSYAASDFMKSLELVGDETVFTYSFDYEVTGTVADNTYIYPHFKGSAPATGNAIVPAQNVEGAYTVIYVKDAMSGHYRSTFVITPAQETSTDINTNRIRLMNASAGTTARVWNFKLEQGLVETPWTPAPEDVDASISSVSTVANNAASKSDAVYRQQRIWYRQTADGAAPSTNTTWLATSGTGYGNWSLSVPQLTSGTTKYPKLYTAVQTQTVSQAANSGTTCSCSPVRLDDSATVVDGATIITGSIASNRLEVYDASIEKISASAIDVDSITIGQSQVTNLSSDLSGLQDDIDNIQVGGRNLLWGTGNLPAKWVASGCTATGGQADPFGGTNAVLIEPTVATHYYCYCWPTHGMPKHPANGRGGVEFTFSIWLKAQSTTASVRLSIRTSGSNKHMETFDVTDSWTLYSITATVPNNITNNDVVWVGQAGTDAYYMSYPKFEQGNKPTDWTPAPEDVSSSISDASKTATTYLTNITGGGINVHPSGNDATSVRITDVVDIIRSNVSVAQFGESARVGATAGPHVSIVSTGMDIYGATDGSQNLAHFGYDTGNTMADTQAVAPYYTIGTRYSSIGNYSVVAGKNCMSSGYVAFAEGQDSKATGALSHAEGAESESRGIGSHAEGYKTLASGWYSHSENNQTEASGNYSHAEGQNTEASGSSSHAEGNGCVAASSSTHAQNHYTIAQATYGSTAMGRYNLDGAFALMIGNGTSDTARSNILTVDWDGNLVIAGGITLGTALTAAQIPNLPASKITSGTINRSRIPAPTTTARGGVMYPTVLYEGTAKGDFTLSAAASGFTHIKVYYTTQNGGKGSTDIYDPDGSKFTCETTCFANSTTMQNEFARWEISGTSVTWQDAGYLNANAGSSLVGIVTKLTDTTNQVTITRVEGWKW